MLEGGHEDNLQFGAVLVFPSSQAPRMGSFTVWLILLVLEKYLRGGGIALWRSFLHLQTRGGPQVSSHLRQDAEPQIPKVKWYEPYPKLKADCAFKIQGLRSTGKTWLSGESRNHSVEQNQSSAVLQKKKRAHGKRGRGYRVIWVERMGMIWGGQQRTLICEKNKRAKVVIFNYIRKRHEEVATYPLGSLLTSSTGRLWFWGQKRLNTEWEEKWGNTVLHTRTLPGSGRGQELRWLLLQF